MTERCGEIARAPNEFANLVERVEHQVQPRRRGMMPCCILPADLSLGDLAEGEFGGGVGGDFGRIACCGGFEQGARFGEIASLQRRVCGGKVVATDFVAPAGKSVFQTGDDRLLLGKRLFRVAEAGVQGLDLFFQPLTCFTVGDGAVSLPLWSSATWGMITSGGL